MLSCRRTPRFLLRAAHSARPRGTAPLWAATTGRVHFFAHWRAVPLFYRDPSCLKNRSHGKTKNSDWSLTQRDQLLDRTQSPADDAQARFAFSQTESREARVRFRCRSRGRPARAFAASSATCRSRRPRTRWPPRTPLSTRSSMSSRGTIRWRVAPASRPARSSRPRSGRPSVSPLPASRTRPARASRPDRAPSRVNPSPVPIPRTMPRAAFASRAPSPEVTAWRGDRRVARWLAERARKDAERRLGPIRRAHRDLDWIIKRRRAQIANCRRDMKNERAERLAEAAERRRRLERLAVKPAARQHEHENAQSALDPPSPPPTRGTHQKPNPTPSLSKKHHHHHHHHPRRRSTRPAAKKPSRAPPSSPPSESPPPPKLVTTSVWIGPGRFQSIAVEKTRAPARRSRISARFSARLRAATLA